MCNRTSSVEWGTVFQKEPPLPPSLAQASLRQQLTVTDKNADRQTYLQTLKSLLTNRNFVLLLLSYGINVGVFYVVSTLLNQIVLLHFAVSNTETPGSR
jgi:FLVCR family feline leukemia virus subgroup C receptor-related protein